MKKSLLASILIFISLNIFTTLAVAKKLEIQCDTPEQCQMKFALVRQWVIDNALLRIDSSRTNYGEGIFNTYPSTIEGTVSYNGNNRWPKSLAVQFSVKLNDSKSISIVTSCANIFTCNPSEVDIYSNLQKFIEDKNPDALVKAEITKKLLSEANEANYARQMQAERDKQAELKKYELEMQIQRRVNSQNAALKTGTHICHFELGETITNPDKTISHKGFGGVIVGFTENYANGKIKISVVNAYKNNDISNSGILYNNMMLQGGSAIWDAPAEWETCGT